MQNTSPRVKRVRKVLIFQKKNVVYTRPKVPLSSTFPSTGSLPPCSEGDTNSVIRSSSLLIITQMCTLSAQSYEAPAMTFDLVSTAAFLGAGGEPSKGNTQSILAVQRFPVAGVYARRSQERAEKGLHKLHLRQQLLEMFLLSSHFIQCQFFKSETECQFFKSWC